MAYTDDYVKTNWINKPATNTPINQTNLNHLEQGVKNNCGRVANLSTTKAEQSDLLTVFKNVSFDSTTGTFTFTKFDNTTITINTDLEKLAVNFDYDDDPNSAHYQNLIITLADGTVKYADLSALITQYEFTDTATIDITVSAGGTISASVIDGSITASKLQPNYLAAVTAQANIATNGANTATSQALVSEGWAKGTQNGTPVASGSPYYENNAEYFKNQAQQIAGAALGGLSDVTITTPTNGQVLTYDADNNIWRNSDGGSVETKSGNPLSLTTDSTQVARSTKITLSPIQASGTPTPSNPIPIYGYDKVGVEVTGNNLFNPSNVISGTIGNDYTIQSSAQSRIVYIKCLANTTYTISKTAGQRFQIGYIETEPTFGTSVYGFVNAGTATNATITTGANAQYLIAFVFNSNYDSGTADQMIASVQIELGSTATAYEPYTEATDISETLPSTIYGGTLDVETGMLSVTHKIRTLNGSENWDTSGNCYYIEVADEMESGNVYLDAICNIAVADTWSNVSASSGATFAYYRDAGWSQGHGRLAFNNQPYGSLATFKTALGSNNAQVVTRLATPYTIQLTPHQVALLEGANVITSNGATITVMYREGKLASLADLEGMANTINEVAEIASGDKSASQITAGTFKGQVNANTTAQANLGTAQVRNIIVTDTAPTVGSSTTIPDGTLIIVYE